MTDCDPGSQAGLRGSSVLNGRCSYTIDSVDWRPMSIDGTVLPGFSWIPLASDEGAVWSSYWMKMAPGARSMVHRHEATELLLIKEGFFSDADGASYAAGDVVTYAAGSTHSSFSDLGCIVLVVTGAPSTTRQID